ncbi:MAG: helix-turn-helix domain-containing protein [Proteobacteria bacterium]|nr:helix-turn-helix domain-containing protein [Pseudomonadota bacterium]
MHRSGPNGCDYETSNEALSRICGAYRIACDRWWEFRGNIATRTAGSLHFADVRFSHGAVIRDRGEGRYRGDHYFLVLQAAGSARMRQRGNEAALEAGDCTLIDSRFASVFEVGTDFHQYSFHFPAQLMQERFGRQALPLAAVIGGRRGAGAILSDLLTSLVRNASSLQGVDLTGVTLQALAAALGTEGEPRQCTSESNSIPSLREIVEYVDIRAHEPDLTPAGIASHFNISLRRLYRLAAPTGCAPAALVWQRRLEQARKMLASGNSRVPILEIALSCGFKDGAHFSRAYRKAYGHPPKLARTAVRSALTL